MWLNGVKMESIGLLKSKLLRQKTQMIFLQDSFFGFLTSPVRNSCAKVAAQHA